jgi:2,3-dihydroxybiphenyl 1,2-dioxygenase
VPSEREAQPGATGVLQLGYLGFEVSATDAWERFATEVLGLQIGERLSSGGFTLRMDSYAARFFVEPGPKDDVSVIGWQVRDEAALREIGGRLESAGCAVSRGTEEDHRARRVSALLKFKDPAGTPTELFWGPDKAPAPFASELIASSFVAEERGLGHAVVTARDKKESTEFYQSLLGFRLSDHIVCQYYGYDVDLSFFHANTRHHSLAIGGRQQKRIHHFMLEVASMDDVGLCFDRALRGGVPIMQTLGRHPNDRMFSFYAKTPSGVQFEFGWGGREVDDATWRPTTYGAISEWGHHPPVAFAPRDRSGPSEKEKAKP